MADREQNERNYADQYRKECERRRLERAYQEFRDGFEKLFSEEDHADNTPLPLQASK